MENLKSYYGLRVYTTKVDNVLRGGFHIIKAYSEEDALRIQKKFGVSYPWGITDPIKVLCKKVNLRWRFNKSMIERRKRGVGGNIWYENENGQLQTET